MTLRPAQRPRQVHRPALAVVRAFTLAALLGALLLLLPAATEGEGGAAPHEALFTAVSAVCVTGLVVVDTPTYWSAFGELVILGLIQVGGFGIMTGASLLGLIVSRRLGLTTRLSAAVEVKAFGPGEVRRLVTSVARTALLVEAAVAALLAARFALGYGYAPGTAAYHGAFHAVSAFNNAGFALYPDNLARFATDPWVCLPVAAAVIAGSLGFPVLLELWRELGRPARWSLQAKLVVPGTVALLALGTAAVLALEWAAPATLGPLGVPGKLLAAFFTSAMARTAGFNTLDYGQVSDATLLATDVLMFIGGGSAGTAGGIKVTTFLVLAFVILTEVRGEAEVHAMGRQVPRGAQRQALTVALLGVAAVVAPALALLAMTPFRLDQVLFEVVSAFANVGLSTGITADLPRAGQLILVALMFLGRLGPVTVASALALHERPVRYRLPEERPIIG